MAHYRVAKRYAKGFMDFLSGTGREEVILDEMKQLQHLIQNNRDLRNFFSSPVIDFKKKTQIMKNIFASFSQESITFMSLIVQQGRSMAMADIAEEFVKLYKNRNGIKNALITSAQPVNQDQIDAILDKAKSFLPEGTKLEVENRVNPDLIGGFILRLDDQQFDGSIRAKLSRIKKEFDSKHYIPKV